MMPIKFHDGDIDKAEEMRRLGEKWVVVQALLGEGIKGACERRRVKRLSHPSPHACADGRTADHIL
jgi:hypothetical protein